MTNSEACWECGLDRDSDSPSRTMCTRCSLRVSHGIRSDNPALSQLKHRPRTCSRCDAHRAQYDD